MSEPRRVDVLIVGAGFAGIGLGIELARRAQESFLIIEQADDVGGTWRDNRYPGVACDVPSHLYELASRPNPTWSRVFAKGDEIQAYLRSCVRVEGLESHLLLGCALESAQWDPAASRWQVHTARGEISAAILIVATGRLSEPRLPAVSGLHNFAGAWWHSARWQPQASLAGQRVGLVGTGASAVQILPQIAQQAGAVVVFQRTPPYVLPRDDHRYSDAELERFAADPQSVATLRAELFAEAERGVDARLRRHPDIEMLREHALDHLAAQVPDPGLRQTLTPDYEIGCKRIVFSDEYFPALLAGNVTLEPSALAQVTADGAIAAGGHAYKLDALVFATGFNTTSPSIATRVHGRDGLPLAERWRDGPAAYASVSVPGFPNMYVLGGPNSALGHSSAILILEAQFGYVLGALDHLAASDAAALEVTETALASYRHEIDELARGTVWTDGGCSSWYRDQRTGRVTLLWPGSAAAFANRHGSFRPEAYKLIRSAA